MRVAPYFYGHLAVPMPAELIARGNLLDVVDNENEGGVARLQFEARLGRCFGFGETIEFLVGLWWQGKGGSVISFLLLNPSLKPNGESTKTIVLTNHSCARAVVAAGAGEDKLRR